MSEGGYILISRQCNSRVDNAYVITWKVQWGIYVVPWRIIQIYSGIACARVFNGELCTQRLQKLIYLCLSTHCFMKISLYLSEDSLQEILIIKQSVDIHRWINFCNLCVLWSRKYKIQWPCLIIQVLNFWKFTYKWSGWVSDSYCSYTSYRYSGRVWG